MTEETTSENTRRTPEVVKTWNIGGVANTEERTTQPDQPAAQPAKPAVYQAPGQARRTTNVPLDVTSQEMFPSIATAEELERKEKEKLKEAEEKKKASTPTPQTPAAPAEAAGATAATPEVVREKPKKEKKIDLTQQLFATQEEPLIPAYRSRYDSPRGGGMDGSRPASGMGRRGPMTGGDPAESPATTESDWRSAPRPAREPQSFQREPREPQSFQREPRESQSFQREFREPREPQSFQREFREPRESQSFQREFREPREPPTSTPRPSQAESPEASTPAETMGNWRTQAKAPNASPHHQPAEAPAQPENTTPTSGKYIPPSMRKRLEGL